MNEMFCFQCQQTAHNTGCTGKAGVCGKKADTANNQDDLIGALIALACTGFSTIGLAPQLERAVGIPVLDPVTCEAQALLALLA